MYRSSEPTTPQGYARSKTCKCPTKPKYLLRVTPIYPSICWGNIYLQWVTPIYMLG